MSDRAYAQARLQQKSLPVTPAGQSLLQHAAKNAAPLPHTVLPTVHNTLHSPGDTLDTATRTFMESRFGYDFSGVRVHTDAKAAESTRAVNALAYTVGRDVVFGAHQYAPHTHAGQKLLAHELTHVVQQGAGTANTIIAKAISQPEDTLEVEADRVASRVVASKTAAGQYTSISRSPQAGLIQRQPIPVKDSPVPLAGPYSGHNPFPPAPAPPQSTDALVKELQALIDGATWKEIRKRVYPKESAAGIKRAKERKQGKRKDLTGLGKIKTLEHFAQAIRAIQKKWASLKTPDNRVQEIGKAASVELTAAEVPKFLALDKERMEFKGYFTHSEWKFVISEELVNSNSLSDSDAAEVANTTLHESRHAEQQFLAARYSAGMNKKDAAEIVAEQGIPKVIADKAVAQKMDARTNMDVATLGQQMYKARVTEGAKNQAISDDDGLKELEDRRKEAVTALNNLKANATPQAIADATAKRGALRQQITVVEQKYTLYRNIPYEADAHEVGDAAEQAFKGWP